MKRLLTICLVLALCVSAFGVPRDSDRAERGAWTGPRIGTGQEDNIKSAMAFLLGATGYASTGNVFWVDSGVDGTTGVDQATALGTIDEAINLCTANRGDLILVMPGHAETMGTASVDADIAGITIKGFGNGSLAPNLTFDTATDTFIIGADNVTVEGLRFITSVTAVDVGIQIETLSDNVTIRDCTFVQASDAPTVDEFVSTIEIVNDATQVTIEDCWFNAGAAGAANAISMCAISGAVIRNNTIFGDYSAGCMVGSYCSAQTVKNSTVPVEIFILDNLMFNGTMDGDSKINTIASLIMPDGASGYIADNRFISNPANSTAAVMRVADDMVLMNNMSTATDGDEFSGGLESGASSVTLSPGDG